MIATTSAPMIRLGETPSARRTAAIASDRNSSTPCRTPQPIDPRIVSPMTIEVPMTARKTAKTTSMKAAAPAAATRPISPAIAVASALARSMWATTRAIAASRTAPIWARRPGGGLRGSRGGDPAPGGGGGPAGGGVAGPGGGGVGGVGSVVGSSRIVLRWVSLGARSAPMIPARRAASRLGARYISGMPEMPDVFTTTTASRRSVLTAEILSIGTELTVGETRDTNAGELAGRLTAAGVRVRRITALPDDLGAVTDAFAAGLARSDLIVSTGGLGPTPDDLTREAIAAACGETVAVDPDLEAWLRELWRRRDMPFPELNLKQAWRIQSCEPLANPNGTAPGWLVDRPDGRVIVALPGPPREMRPMWADEVMPRLRERGLGSEVASRTYRLTGIGESQVAEMLGESLLRGTNPIVATYARVEAVDVRVSAVADGGRTAQELVEEASATVLDHVGTYVWAVGDTSWGQAIGDRLRELGWTLAIVEIGTGASLASLFADAPWVRFDESIAADAPAAVAHREGRSEPGEDGDDSDDAATDDLVRYAAHARDLGGTEVGLAVRARPRAGDTAVSIAISTPRGILRVRRVVFLTGPMGRSRAALTSAAALLETLREDGPTDRG